MSYDINPIDVLLDITEESDCPISYYWCDVMGDLRKYYNQEVEE
jgi:hypothetical protein